MSDSRITQTYFVQLNHEPGNNKVTERVTVAIKNEFTIEIQPILIAERAKWRCLEEGAAVPDNI